MTGYLIKREMWTQTHTQAEPHVNINVYRGVTLLQPKGCQRLSANTRSRREVWDRFSLQATEGEALPALSVGLLDSKTVRKYISVVSGHPICGILFQQPWETNVGR